MIQDDVIYQDNQSAIILDKNGNQYSSKRTRQINIRSLLVPMRITFQSKTHLEELYMKNEN